MKQIKWLMDEKLPIVLEEMIQTKSVSEICREHQIAQSQYYTWRDKFLEGDKNALNRGNSTSKKCTKLGSRKFRRPFANRSLN